MHEFRSLNLQKCSNVGRDISTSRKCGHFVRSFSKLSKVRTSVAKFPRIRKCATFGFEEVSNIFENVHILVVTFLKVRKCPNFGRKSFKKFEVFAIFANGNYKFRKRWNFQDRHLYIFGLFWKFRAINFQRFFF